MNTYMININILIKHKYIVIDDKIISWNYMISLP